jgi:hypothetical protein
MKDAYKFFILPLVKFLIDEFIADGYGEYEQPLAVFYEWLRERANKE